ncbi:dihydroorotate dehydrogenase-like protein [Aliikangiella marina]|uniref:Dihydroorotate dehydrogenase-like protein n=1 Tax=Aliikangiella marina TaxID=1712262 RepID=A0A545TJE4_9GAMM|nr:dihydroorotate dehydrogenase-like protein [Aliikangiella marina]TQV77350.1 dihydroorotate dehydrogenase-like protein [Aliikangiella marina]
MTNKLATQYLGLELANPFVPSSSPMSRDIDIAKQLEDAGASGLVMHSLFEEEIKHQHEQLHRFVEQQNTGFQEASSFLPMSEAIPDARDNYLECLQQLKSALDIPIIASLNGTSIDGWIEYGKALEQAGANALELNVYHIAASKEETASEVEERYFKILTNLKEQVLLPITVKLSSQHSAPVNFICRLKTFGAMGVSMFNRFYVPDINLESLKIEPAISLSTSAESLLRIRWIAFTRGQVDIDIAATGGLHTTEDIIKALLAGADVTHLCSALLQHGPYYLGRLIRELNEWLDENEYDSIEQMKGSLSCKNAINPSALERTNYLEVIDSYQSALGVHL